MSRTPFLPALLCSVSALLSPGLAAAAAADSSARSTPPPAAMKPKLPEQPSAAGVKATPSAEVGAPKPKPQAMAPQAPKTTAPVAVASAPPNSNSKTEAPLPPARTPLEAAVRGVVVLERGGKPLALGSVLNGDGRILTALSPLTHGNQIDARYPDGRLVRVRLSNSDRAWDLALLEPQADGPRAGLKATRDSAKLVASKLHLVSFVHDKVLGTSDMVVKGQTDLHGGDSVELGNALTLVNAKASDVGAPLLNDEGEVVAIVARACSPSDQKTCTLAPYGAPVSAIRGFLRAVPARRGPWLGVETVAFDAGLARGVRVAALAPSGPAARAGLHAGPPGIADVILGVDGMPVSSAEAFADAVDNHALESTLHLLVLSEGRYREVAIVLHPPPGAAGPASPASATQ